MKKSILLISFVVIFLVLLILAFQKLSNKSNLVYESPPIESLPVKKVNEDRDVIPSYVPNELIIKYKTEAEANKILNMNEIRIGSLKKTVPVKTKKTFSKILQSANPSLQKELSKVVTIQFSNLPHANMQNIAKNFKEENKEIVEYAHPNFLYKISFVPNDPLYSNQWAHQNTEAEFGWDIERGSNNVTVAIIDTGVAFAHEDLSTNMLGNCNGGCPTGTGFDFVDIDYIHDYQQYGFTLIPDEDYTLPDNVPSDYYGHGTHVAGIAAAVTDNNEGVAGVCHYCKIMPVRAGFGILYYGRVYGILEDDDIVNAIYYATNNGADIISMSFGTSQNSPSVEEAINYSRNNGVVLVAAAGNANSFFPVYPAAYKGVIAVTATTENNRRASFSSFGIWTDVGAPGVEILSTVPLSGYISDPSGYRALSGTSMSTPYVSGLAGLILSHNPELDNTAITDILRQGIDEVAEIYYYIGTGRVNIRKALEIDYIPSETVKIKVPEAGSYVTESTNITGTAAGDYVLELGRGNYPEEWTNISSGSQVFNNTLGYLDIQDMENGYYSLRLKVNNGSRELYDTIVFSIFEGGGYTQLVIDTPQYFPEQYLFTVFAARDKNSGCLYAFDPSAESGKSYFVPGLFDAILINFIGGNQELGEWKEAYMVQKVNRTENNIIKFNLSQAEPVSTNIDRVLNNLSMHPMQITTEYYSDSFGVYDDGFGGMGGGWMCGGFMDQTISFDSYNNIQGWHGNYNAPNSYPQNKPALDILYKYNTTLWSDYEIFGEVIAKENDKSHSETRRIATIPLIFELENATSNVQLNELKQTEIEIYQPYLPNDNFGFFSSSGHSIFFVPMQASLFPHNLTYLYRALDKIVYKTAVWYGPLNPSNNYIITYLRNGGDAILNYSISQMPTKITFYKSPLFLRVENYCGDCGKSFNNVLFGNLKDSYLKSSSELNILSSALYITIPNGDILYSPYSAWGLVCFNNSPSGGDGGGGGGGGGNFTGNFEITDYYVGTLECEAGNYTINWTVNGPFSPPLRLYGIVYFNGTEFIPRCGNNIVERGELCDGRDDYACPSRCTSFCKCVQPIKKVPTQPK